MNDPHVEKLYYRFISESPEDNFEKAQPLAITLGSFDVEIRDGRLCAIPQDHFPDEESAKTAFEPLLRSWESAAFLSPNKLRIRFKFDRAYIIDRNLTPGVIELNAAHISISAYACGIAATVDHHLYPPPDMNFAASALTDELIYRLRQYKDGRQALPHVAYYILDRLEQEYFQGKSGKSEKTEKRKVLVRQLKIEGTVLDKFGSYSNKKDAKIGRHGSRIDTPLTSEELNWLEEVAFRIVKRVGEINSGINNLPDIKLSDFSKV